MATSDMEEQIFSITLATVHPNKGILRQVSCHLWVGQSVML